MVISDVDGAPKQLTGTSSGELPDVLFAMEGEA